MHSFKTPKGTELPLKNIQGKQYLQVAHRLVWFREDRPNWTIETEIRTPTPDSCIAKATIKDESGRVMSTAHKTENVKGFGDFIEKAETGAIGRALALCGFGTQFAEELEEGERIVDSPVTSREHFAPPSQNISVGDFVVPFGKKYKGRKLKEIEKNELKSYCDWIESEAHKKGEPPSEPVQDFLDKANDFLGL